MSASSDPSPSVNKPPQDNACLNAEVYAELRRVASQRMSHLMAGSTLQPTVLVHEAWLRLSKRESPWADRSHYLAGAVTAMRHILIDHARRKARVRHGGACDRATTLTLGQLAEPDPDARLLLIDEAVQALEKVNPVGAQIVVARFFGGLSTREIAEALGLGERSVERHWAAAKVWLYRWMQKETRA